MSMTVKSFEQILADMKSRDTTGLVTTEGSFVDAVLRPVAYALAAYNYDLAAQAAMASPQTAVGEYLEAQARDYGLTRLSGTRATAFVTFSGAEGTVIPVGTAVQTKSGLVFLTGNEVVIENGNATTAVSAEAVGSNYNVPENSICTMQSFSAVAIAAATVAAGGTDAESDDALRNRLNNLRANSPASGNAAQYESWAQEAGAGKAKAVGRWDGNPGTVKIFLLDANMHPAGEDLIAAVSSHIEPQRDVCHEVTYAAAGNVDVSIAATVSVVGTTAAVVQATLSEVVSAYFAEISLTGQPVSYNKISYLLLSIPGVTDFSALTLNGGAQSVTVSSDAAPVLKAVSVT